MQVACFLRRLSVRHGRKVGAASTALLNATGPCNVVRASETKGHVHLHAIYTWHMKSTCKHAAQRFAAHSTLRKDSSDCSKVHATVSESDPRNPSCSRSVMLREHIISNAKVLLPLFASKSVDVAEASEATARACQLVGDHIVLCIEQSESENLQAADITGSMACDTTATGWRQGYA
jgi:hypothetical protein